ncbi:disulfide bond formation protein B [Pusillimonas sp.]|uniref:disulfide bond formation protein B n=1 Tax=Pusillimonas sp. TaxID=3040095 RepID=UPI0037C669CF
MKKAILSHGFASLLTSWAICAALIVALYHQLFNNDLPCALCWLQRFAMLAMLVAQTWILLKIGKRQTVSIQDVALGHGLTILAALVGMSMSLRQVLLHILPGDPGYGGEVMGLHFYTWGFVLFFCCMAGSALTVALSNWLDRTADAWHAAARWTMWLIAALILINWVLVFAMQGFQWELDGDPTHYRLFSFS